MTRRLQLSELVALVQETIEDRFYEDSFWIKAEITDVKRYDSKRWCFLKFIEKQGNTIATEMQGVFWANAFQQIVLFERITKQLFKDGLEISCRVQVKFHPKYGLKLEVLEIDTSFALGKIEMERQQTLDRLLKENPFNIRLVDDEYITRNKQLKLPAVVQRIALITAPNSDGQRDFKQELLNNNYGYYYEVKEFLTQIQGANAASLITDQLRSIFDRAPEIDVVVIVRGGGSQTDLKPFDDYELARLVATFPIPVFTGIGHDRNTSIADLMARQFKTPTKVAAAINDINFRFDNEIQLLASRLGNAVSAIISDKQNQLKKWDEKVDHLLTKTLDFRNNNIANFKEKLQRKVQFIISHRHQQLKHASASLEKSSLQLIKNRGEKLASAVRLINQLSPQTILNRGFAMVTINKKIITDTNMLQTGQQVTTLLGAGSFNSTINEVNTHDKSDI